METAGTRCPGEEERERRRRRRALRGGALGWARGRDGGAGAGGDADGAARRQLLGHGGGSGLQKGEARESGCGVAPEGGGRETRRAAALTTESGELSPATRWRSPDLSAVCVPRRRSALGFVFLRATSDATARQPARAVT
jgi:hypothetical protein